MELTKPSTLTFSQELVLAMKDKQEKEEKQKELQDLSFLVKPQPFIIDYSKILELKEQNEIYFIQALVKYEEPQEEELPQNDDLWLKQQFSF